MNNYYERYPEHVVEHGEFKHVMAVTLNPRSHYRDGVIRCIKSRAGDLATRFIDRSELHILKSSSLFYFDIAEKLEIQQETEIISELNQDNLDYLGLEDPDIWIDEATGLMHLYFTIPLIDHEPGHTRAKIHLGHAVGKDLHSLVMTMPVLTVPAGGHAKEVSIAPINKQGIRLNLVESNDVVDGVSYSTVRVAIARDMGGPWEFGETAFHPAKSPYAWIGGHASPGPLFSKNFIDLGEGKLLGIINGCEANTIVNGEKRKHTFAVGLFVYDYEKGDIEWVSSEPLIEDSQSEGRKITFASQFVETVPGKGILYAHIDDSYVCAYELDAQRLKELIPQKYFS